MEDSMTTLVQLFISCTNLADMDKTSKSDPTVEVLFRSNRTHRRRGISLIDPADFSSGTDSETVQWYSLGRTEIVWNDLNPQFS